MTSSPIETRRILFCGRVQAVGFRWTTSRLAANYAVSGYVSNLHDGRVELVVQGSPKDISGLIDDIREHFRNNITADEETTIPEPETITGFRIRR